MVSSPELELNHGSNLGSDLFRPEFEGGLVVDGIHAD